MKNSALEFQNSLEFKLFFKGSKNDERYLANNATSLFSEPLKYLENLKSPFCFVLAKNNELICARSLFCADSLYYYHENNEFLYDFDKKALLKKIPLKLDLSALNSYLSQICASKSFFAGLKELKSGELLSFKNNKLKISVFDDLNDISNSFDTLEFQSEKIITSLNNEIGKYLYLRPATLLSGGLDSSLLCALFARQSKGKITAFNLAFKDESHYDESDFARLSADFIGCELESINLSQNDFILGFETLFDYLAEPHGDSAVIALRFLSQNIANAGFNAVFSAEGADECFLGYDLYFRVLEFYFSDLKGSAYPKISKDSEYLRRKALNLPIYGGFYEVFTKYQKELLFAHAPKELLDNSELFGSQSPLDKQKSPLFSMRKTELTNPNALLKKLGAMSDILSIKTPFFALAKYALSIENPSPNLVPKELLKSLASKQKLLPEQIIYRKKKGLSTPFLEWILRQMDASEQILRANKILAIPLFSEVFVRELERKARRGRFKQHLWSLLVFSKWLEKYFG